MPMPRLWILLCYLVALMLPLAPVPASADDAPHVIQRHLVTEAPSQTQASFLSPEQAFQASSALDAHGPYIELHAAPGYYLYRDRVRLIQAGEDITPHAQFSEAQQKNDPAYGQVRVYHERARIELPAWQHQRAAIDIHYQGCAEAGLCYPPMHKTLQAPNKALATPPSTHPALLPSSITSTDTTPTPPPSTSLSFWTMLMLYAAGIGLTFTPCVLPMLPIACAIVVGRSPSRRQALGLSLAYVAGMVVAYALLGILVGVFGSSLRFQAQLQRPMILIPMAGACVFAAGWLFDLYQVRLPLWLSSRMQRTSDTRDASHQRGVFGTAITGALSTLVLSPCLSAPLAGVLIYLSTTGNIITAMLGLVALSLGMGTPIVICCTFGAGLLPRAGAWMNVVKGFFGLMLLGMAIWLLERLLSPSCSLLLWGIWGLGMAHLMGIRAPLQQGFRAALQALSWAVALWSAVCIIGAAAGGHDFRQPLAPFSSSSQPTTPTEAAMSSPANQWATFTNITALQQALDSATAPVLVDIYADWCVSCQHMEQSVYANSELRPVLNFFQGIRLDVTHPDDATLGFLQQHGLFGPPGLLFFVKGQEAVNDRLVGEHSREEVEKHLRAVLNAAQNATTHAQP